MTPRELSAAIRARQRRQASPLDRAGFERLHQRFPDTDGDQDG